MSNKKRKAKILRATVKYLVLKTDRHEELLTKYWAELEGVDAVLKRVLEMSKLLNANKEN
jgi:hypothetical protein